MAKKEWKKPEFNRLDVSGTLGGDPLFPQEGQFIPNDGGDPIDVGPGS